MTREELRIGNLITDKWASEGSAFEVITLSSKYPIVMYGAKLSANIENIRGVPLTEEWLIKFGFNKVDSGEFERSESKLPNYVIGIWPVPGNSGNHQLYLGRQPHVHYTATHVQYTHQLQNLYFALTGSELEIKNPRKTPNT